MKTAIVTGASGNLGEAVVEKFLTGGFNVIGTVLHHDIEQSGNKALEKVMVDLGDEEKAGAFVQSVIDKNQSIDVAVLTVGGFAKGKLADTKASDIKKQFKLNFETAYNVARPVFLQMMKQKSGHIFLIGSRPGLDLKSGKGMVAYSLAKSMLFGLAEILNETAKGTGVVTSVVIPSTIDTQQNRESMPDANFDNWVKAEEIAGIIHFYCTEEGRQLREPLLKVYGNA